MKTNKSFQINIPISKVDEEQRIVTGIATTEALDSQGDIVDYEASKKAFTEWGGNIREMHGSTAVGKAIDIQFDDENKQVILSSYISESADGQNAWTKIKEGILTGYSIGGRMLEVIKDKANDGANRIMNYSLSETSLVDNPANPEAEFVMVKSFDGRLNHVEAIVDNNKLPETWWMEKFMSGKQIKKSVYDAATAIDIASQLAWLIMSESWEDEGDQSQLDQLKAAFDALKQFTATEVQENDDYLGEFNEVIEMGKKAIDLRKASMAEKDSIEKKGVAVVDGEPRDEKATVVPAVINGGKPVKKSTSVVGGEERDENADVVSSEEVVAEDVVSTTEEAPVEPIVEAPIVETVTEDVVAEAPAEVVVEDTAKTDVTSDLSKNIETLLAKLSDSQSGVELQKVTDGFQKLSDKVEKSLTSLEGRLATLESQPVPTKGAASYAVIGKGDSEVETDLTAILKRQNELVEHPMDAKPGEHEAIARAIRNAQKSK